MNLANPTPEFPADAYPRGVYASDRHVTPDTVRVDASEDTLILWVGGDMIAVARDADDTRLQATLHLARHMSQQAERFGALVRAELEARQRTRQAEPIAAAMRGPSHARPTPAAPAPATGDLFTPKSAGPAAPEPRYCTGCGNLLHPANPDQPAAAGASPEDTRPECPRCRASLLAEQVRGRTDQPPAPPPPVMPETGLMTAIPARERDGGRPR